MGFFKSELLKFDNAVNPQICSVLEIILHSIGQKSLNPSKNVIRKILMAGFIDFNFYTIVISNAICNYFLTSKINYLHPYLFGNMSGVPNLFW
jgi:hypothetical protein